MPLSGSMANCMTLVSIVIAPTAISPPYLSKDELKQTEITLSLDCMIKVASPSVMHGRIILGETKKFFAFRRNIVFLPKRNATTQTHETHCDIIVASAAPLTPICSPKINIGSSTIFDTAPIITVTMPIFAKPCAVINAFMPSVSWTKTVPMA